MENNSKNHHRHVDSLTIGGLVIALGIIYGDIGTSPLYVLKAIIGDKVISKELIYGGLGCIFWTLTLQTTLKYVIITLRADNNGEGGIFSLYALVKRRRPHLIFPAIIGGCALLADGVITPPISVASAVEGLRIIKPDINTVPIVIVIITLLFFLQRGGTSLVGKAFGPVMFIWFAMLGYLGLANIGEHIDVLNCLKPYYAYNLLVNYPQGFWILGAVFLCTTGAEALYSDLGHCGRKNIRISWIFVKTALVINYFGQGAHASLPIWANFMSKVAADPACNLDANASFERPSSMLNDFNIDFISKDSTGLEGLDDIITTEDIKAESDYTLPDTEIASPVKNNLPVKNSAPNKTTPPIKNNSKDTKSKDTKPNKEGAKPKAIFPPKKN
jgi:hypothetical protein